MQIYISWSKTLSKLVAEELNTLLTYLFGDSVEVFLSPLIDSGTDWFHENQRRLRSAGFGLILVSRRSLDAPWLCYESGALLNRTSGQSQIILLDVKTTDLKDSLFQHLQCIEFLSPGYERIFQRIAEDLAGTGSNISLPRQWGDFLNITRKRVSLLCEAEKNFLSIRDCRELEMSRKSDAFVYHACVALVESRLANKKIRKWLEEERIPLAAYAKHLADLRPGTRPSR